MTPARWVLANPLKAMLILFLMIAIVGLGVSRCQLGGARQKSADAQSAAAQSGAMVDSGRDAVTTVSDRAIDDAAIDAQTRENDRAIRSAPGASAPVDDGVNAAGLRALCVRRAYRDRVECRTMQPAAAP